MDIPLEIIAKNQETLNTGKEIVDKLLVSFYALPSSITTWDERGL